MNTVLRSFFKVIVDRAKLTGYAVSGLYCVSNLSDSFEEALALLLAPKDLAFSFIIPHRAENPVFVAREATFASLFWLQLQPPWGAGLMLLSG